MPGRRTTSKTFSPARCTNFCYEEVGVRGGFKSGRWRAPVRKLADAGQLEPFTKVSTRNTDQLSGQQHAQVFAYVDFLIATAGGQGVRGAGAQAQERGRDPRCVTRDGRLDYVGIR